MSEKKEGRDPMPKKDDRHRVPAVIESVKGPHTEDHGILTTMVTVKAGYGYHQGFGGLCLDKGKIANSYVSALCKAFDVKTMDELVGKKCFALYCFGEHNEPIEGLESADTGRRFLHNAWRKKHFPETVNTLAQKIESIRSTIAWAKRRVVEEEARLAALKSHYVDWERQ